ncbi:hypothetical protein FRC10_001033 [Ceratobasidium sp. 414]|nr:hypothetical protein FRC10_001033 [Ceratobasidium sp. 414]
MFFSASTLLSVFSLTGLVLATPLSVNPPKTCGCPLSGVKPNLTGTTGLSIPSGSLVYVALGMGTQNYTCGSTGTFTSAGAVAKLFDISCLANTGSLFANIQNMAFDAASTAKGAALVSKIESLIKSTPLALGDHYFIPNPAVNGTGLSPEFDFRAGVKKGDPTGFAVVKKIANSASPAGTANVDWLALQNIGGTIGGSLANNVMRLDTKSGQPPASCTPNSTIAVPYAAKYWFYK